MCFFRMCFWLAAVWLESVELGRSMTGNGILNINQNYIISLEFKYLFYNTDPFVNVYLCAYALHASVLTLQMDVCACKGRKT